MPTLNILTLSLTLTGASMLCVSLFPVCRLLRTVRRGPIFLCWTALTVMILAFIVGYIFFAIAQVGHFIRPEEAGAAIVLCGGGLFVLGVTTLSSVTMKDVMRIAVLERDAFRDQLTGLHNRRFLDTFLSQAVSDARRYSYPFAILLLDIDHFKRVNDWHGHAAGDLALRAVADMLNASSRPQDLTVRYGGEEFVVVLSNTLFAEAQVQAERLRAAIEALVPPASANFPHLTISIGCTSWGGKDTSVSLLERADSLLYEAKGLGRNRVRSAPGRQQASAIRPIAHHTPCFPGRNAEWNGARRSGPVDRRSAIRTSPVMPSRPV